MAGLLGFDPSDPQTYQTLGLLAGLGKAGEASRLPTGGLGGAIAQAAGGLLGGTQAGNLGILQAQEAEKNRLGNAMALSRLQYLAQRHPEMFPGGVPNSGSLGLNGSAIGSQPSGGGLLGLLGFGGSPGPSTAPSSGIGYADKLGLGRSGAQPADANSGSSQSAPQTANTNTSGSSSLFDRDTESKILDAQFLGLPEAVIASQIPKPVIGGDRPGVLPQYFNPRTGRYEADMSSLPAMEAGQFAASRGKAQGELGAKESEAAFQAGLKVKTENETLKRQAFYQTGVMPPDYGAANSPSVQPSTGNIATPKGTVVPAAPQTTTFPGTDAITKQNTNTQETEKNFGAIRGTLDGTEARMVALAKSLQTVQSGGLNEKRAEIANNLRGAGLAGPADFVMSGKDTAAVQSALGLQTLDILGQLKQINQGTGGRILNSEFSNLLNKQYGPDLSPQANYDLITQALGGVYQTRNMIDDYYKYGKPSGWRDANAFQSAYYSKPENAYQNMVDQAGKAVGPLKGMMTPPPTAVKHLQTNPSLAPDFDAKYGVGASKQYLGTK